MKAGKQVSSAVRIDAGLNYEFRISPCAATRPPIAAKFLKPTLTDWKAKSGWHSQFSIRRTVAQLDFYDFISSAQLSDDRINGGNADLQPQRTWVRATVDRPLFGSSLIKFDLGDHISMLQDRILTEEGFDAPGNIRTGKRMFAHLSIDAPLDRLDLLALGPSSTGPSRTRVHDPISDEERDFSNYYPSWEMVCGSPPRH